MYTSIFFERGSQQPLHRDTPYFYTGKKIPDYMGFWAALEDVDESNGPLIAMKKSHILGEPDLISLRNQYFKSQNVPPSHDGLFNSYNSECLKMAESMGLVAEQFPMKKGGVIIWNASTLQGGASQLDLSKTRKSFVMHITPKNTPVKHMGYFFQQDKQNIPKAEWNYLNYREREFVNTNVVDFMHKKQVKVKDLV